MEARKYFLRTLLDELPATTHAFAYGSGIFAQPGLYTKTGQEKAVLDFFLVVKDSAAWHAEV